MDGILPVYKPVELTSYDVIRAFKRVVHLDYKIGHGGTLDPFAEGVLLLLLGKATKQMNALMALPKTYRATVVLGARSDTLDRTGVITPFDHYTIKSLNQIKQAAEKFVGEIEQEIPEYSAAKVNGVPRYKLARRGIEQEKKTKRVKVYELRITNYAEQKVTFETTVSSGTYIRQLSYDLFKSLGIESYLESLVRVRIGDFAMDDCAQIAEFTTEEWQGKVKLPSLPARGE